MGLRTWRDLIHFPRNHPRSRTEDKKTINDSDNKAIQAVTNSTGFSPLGTLFHMLRLRGSTRSKKLRAEEQRETPPVPEEKESLFRGVPVLDGATLYPPPGAADLQRCRLGGTPVTAKRTDLLREVEVLAEIRHPNILLLMGLMKMEPYNITVVFEDTIGTIYQLLHEKSCTFTYAEVRVLMVQLCEVMIFLHEKGWLHTAISSHTILITKNNLLKLSGFEFAQNIYRKRDSRVEERSVRSGRFGWQSPEQLLGPGGACKSSDVFSSAMVFWELCTGRVPWNSMSVDDLVKTYATDGAASLLQDRSLPSAVRELLQKSLTVQVQRRKMDFVKMMEAILAINLQICYLVFQEEHSGGAALKKVRVTSQPRPQTAKFNTNFTSEINREESSPKNLAYNWYSVKSNPQNKDPAASVRARKCMCQKSEFESVNNLPHQNKPDIHRKTNVRRKNCGEEVSVPNQHGSRNTDSTCESSTKQYQPTAIKPASHQNQRTVPVITALLNGDEEKSKTTSSTIDSTESFQRNRNEMSYQCFDANSRTRVKQLALAIDTFVSKWEMEGQPLKEKTSALVDPVASRLYGRIVRAIKRVADRYPHLFAFSVPRECPTSTIYQSKLFEQKVKHPTRAEQTNSKRRITELKAARSSICETEDLYIDDDFANGLDLDPHMQLLFSFDDLRPGKYRFIDYAPSVLSSCMDFTLDGLLET